MRVRWIGGGDGFRPVCGRLACRISGAGDGRQRVVVAVQAGAEIINLCKIKSFSGIARNSIDQMILMRAEWMTLQTIKLIIAKRG